MPQTDFFGILNYDKIIEFDEGIISPVDNFEDIRKWIETSTNEDGFLYPPYSSTWKVDPRTEEPIEEIPKTKRCAHLYKIPASHKIQFNEITVKEEQFRHNLGGFIVYLFSYLFGTRLQFHDWWVYGRIPITDNARTNDFYIDKSTISHFITHSLKTYNGLETHKRKLLVNIIYMHSMSPLYKCDWEKFIIEYMVFDGCFKLAELLYKIRANSHKQRIIAICKLFGIPYKEKIDLIIKIYRLRNDLFHETLWDNSLPGHAVSNIAFMAPAYLRDINQRIIPALLNYMTPYIKTNWWVRGYHSFDLPE